MSGSGTAKKTLKDNLQATGKQLLSRFMELARQLHDHPELSGQERASAALLAASLSREGFQVEMGVAGLPTAFVARKGRPGTPVLAFLAEYDALPEIGHGCGHNLIGAAAVGAGIVLGRFLKEVGGEVRVIGTPAEETSGGKVTMADAGTFNGLDAALMVHPGSEDRVSVDSLACQTLQVVYRGREAHAVAHPEKGINALDPLLALFSGRDALLRRSRSDVKVVGVINEGGLRPNIIPARAAGSFSLRAPSRQALRDLVGSFSKMGQALGDAHGCQVEILKTDGAYHEMISNRALSAAYQANLETLGTGVVEGPRSNKGSLDMGNVSYLVPSLHPFFALVPPHLSSHTREFARATLSSSGRRGLLRSVQALAMTGLDVLMQDDLRLAMHAEHKRFLEGVK